MFCFLLRFSHMWIVSSTLAIQTSCTIHRSQWRSTNGMKKSSLKSERRSKTKCRKTKNWETNKIKWEKSKWDQSLLVSKKICFSNSQLKKFFISVTLYFCWMNVFVCFCVKQFFFYRNGTFMPCKNLLSSHFLLVN